jgi:hypothetical protein
LTTPIAIEGKDDVPTIEDIVFQTEQELVDDMLQTMSEQEVKEWVSERLMSLHEYVLERDRQGKDAEKPKCHKESNDQQATGDE